MRRDMMKTVSKVMGSLPARYDMNIDEIAILMKKAIIERNVAEAIEIAFDWGFVMGNRATHSGRVKKL